MTDPLALSRRDVLRLLAGLPLVVGLPGRARAQGCEDGAEPDGGVVAPADALARARALGRPALLVVVPTGEWRAVYGPRQRLARHLDALLSTKDEAARLVVANVVVVCASEADLRAAVPELEGEPAAAPGAPSPVWLLEPVGGRLTRLEGALDAADDAAARLADPLAARAVPRPPDALAARRDLELRALGEARAAVERDLAALGAAAAADRDAASARLAGRADALAATLTLLALAPRGDDEVKARARDLVLRAASAAVPAGARWARWAGGCGVERPYEETPSEVACGMAAVPDGARRILILLAP